MTKVINQLFGLATLIICTSCSQIEKMQQNSKIPQVAVADTVAENNGLKTFSSPYDVVETANRLENIIQAKGLTLFSRIDHSANAAKVDIELRPTQVLIFGNPKVGTPLMQCSPTTAIDLPQKILVLQDDSNQTQIIYNMPDYLQQRHNITGCDEILAKVTTVLESIATEAIK